MRRVYAAVALFCFLTRTLAAAGAFDEGTAAGNGALGTINGMVNDTSASAAVPGYTTSPPQTVYYNQPNLATQAQTALAKCALTPADPVCQAQTGAMASANTPRPAISAYDPSVQAARDITKNPTATLGDLSVYYSSCATSALTLPATTVSKICHRYSGIGNYRCGKSLTVSVTRTPSCTPGDWFAHAQSGATGLDVQCLPDKPATAQHFRVTSGSTTVAAFDVDMTVPIGFPKPVADLGWSKLWIASDTCSATTCSLTAMIAPDHGVDCSGGRGCTTIATFLPIYAACAAGTQSGDDIRCSTLLGGCASPNLDAGKCYAPATAVTAYRGYDVTGTYSGYFWNPVSDRLTLGWTVNPAWRGAISRVTLSYAQPAMTTTTTDTWNDGCSALAAGGRCTAASADVCVDGPSTKTIDGQPVTRACWQTRQTFTCASAAPTDECTPLAAAGCTPAGSVCRQTDPGTGLCQIHEDTYGCPAPAMTTTTVGGCPSSTLCIGPNCFDVSHPPDPDFARVASMMEAGREAGNYLDTASMQVFKGEADQCRKGPLHAYPDCCAANTTGAAMNNLAVSGGGSSLVFDVLFPTVAVGSALGYVNPWATAVLAALDVLTQCSPAEGRTALKEGAGLCHTVGDWCSQCAFPDPFSGKCAWCADRSDGKCCFNSKLARIINVQGRVQVGKGWGSPEFPDCSGFSIAQLESLDFAAMDLSEFYASLSPTVPNLTTLQGSNTTKASTCYYGQGKC